MPKNRVEIQKVYRERQNMKKGEEYLEKEGIRRKTLIKKRVEQNPCVRKHREKKKRQAAESKKSEKESLQTERQNSTASSGPLIIKLDFSNKRKGSPTKALERVSKALAKAYRPNKSLESNSKLHKNFGDYKRSFNNQLQKTLNDRHRPKCNLALLQESAQEKSNKTQAFERESYETQTAEEEISLCQCPDSSSKIQPVEARGSSRQKEENEDRGIYEVTKSEFIKIFKAEKEEF
ncbi:uncharacterized protein LOC116290321 [Actinia tenebrosa]|uniref:Uncharacterized protein LOC116290321 n=1 Tax=Actinia tenebrosa TaxID=6105 RepID=A0A6P8HKG3_ACTTE|nr:uncharacterized protein LOC116290321 [Actinia tenebrosa]